MKARRFGVKLMLAALMPSILLAIILSYLWLTWSQRSLENALSQRVEALAGQLASTAEFHLFTGDVQALHALTGLALERDADLVGAAILDARGETLAQSSTMPGQVVGSAPLWPAKDVTYRSRLVKPIRPSSLQMDDPFSAQSESQARSGVTPVLGHVVLEISLQNLYRERDRQLSLGLITILSALAGAGLLAMYLANGVTRPIGRIMSVVERIGQGDKNARVEPDPDCVLYQLEIGINRMAEKVAVTQDDLRARIEAATDELVAQKEIAELQARIDPLTGLHNRRAFMERVELELHRADRYETRLCLIMLDLDFFKDVNDKYGHDAGDRVLVALANLLRLTIRDVDFVARVGGEEFVVLMPETDWEAARHAAERMRQAIRAMRVELDAVTITRTASFGIAEYAGGDIDVAALIVAADRALYAAKDAGRDRVCVQGVDVLP